MAVSTGIDRLDAILGGGFPENRTVLVAGPPGSGKSTLAMHFLQAGLEAGEECTYVSTEQTLEELRDSFEPFPFDLETDSLTALSVHPRPGEGSERYERGDVIETYGGGGEDTPYVLRTLEGTDEIDRHQVGFTVSNLREFLAFNASGDRIVLDGVSGLQGIGDDEDAYRRLVLELIQLCTDELDATALFTAEAPTRRGRDGTTNGSPIDPIQYNFHGVLRLHRRRIRGTDRRFLEVAKLRGTAYDDRQYELTFDDDGVCLLPERRTASEAFIPHEHVPTGIDGLDTLLGGGLIRGEPTLLRHDSETRVEPIVYACLSNLLEEEYSIAFLPDHHTDPLVPKTAFERLGVSMADLLERDRLFVFDPPGKWPDHRNVFELDDDGTDLREAVTTARDRARGAGLAMSFDTKPLVHLLGADATRLFRSWLQADVRTQRDVVVDVQNPSLLQDKLAEFYTDSAAQVLETWRDETGIQYVQLRQSPTGEVGAVRLVDYLEQPPYVRVVS